MMYWATCRRLFQSARRLILQKQRIPAWAVGILLLVSLLPIYGCKGS